MDNWTSHCSRQGSRLLETGALPGRRSKQQQLPPLPYPCCHGGIEMVVLGMVSFCSRLGAGGGVVGQSTAPR